LFYLKEICTRYHVSITSSLCELSWCVLSQN
jgi:hypothetical protein